MNEQERYKPHDPNRNAFENYFKSQGEFESMIINKLRNKEVSFDIIKNKKLMFVGLLIGKNEAEKLSPQELDIFSKEAISTILRHEKMVADSKGFLSEEAERAGFIGGYNRNADGSIIKEGGYDDLEEHLKK